MTFEEWVASDEGVNRFGLELRQYWIDAACIGWNAASENCAKICKELPYEGHDRFFVCAEAIRKGK